MYLSVIKWEHSPRCWTSSSECLNAPNDNGKLHVVLVKKEMSLTIYTVKEILLIIIDVRILISLQVIVMHKVQHSSANFAKVLFLSVSLPVTLNHPVAQWMQYSQCPMNVILNAPLMHDSNHRMNSWQSCFRMSQSVCVNCSRTVTCMLPILIASSWLVL